MLTKPFSSRRIVTVPSRALTWRVPLRWGSERTRIQPVGVAAVPVHHPDLAVVGGQQEAVGDPAAVGRSGRIEASIVGEAATVRSFRVAHPDAMVEGEGDAAGDLVERDRFARDRPSR